MVYDLAETGNLVSASIPVALSRALESGRAKPGQLAMLCGFGVGLSWGAALVDL
jgi:3-oxoacyl-[acyl-carrier-protein] synthase-3